MTILDATVLADTAACRVDEIDDDRVAVLAGILVAECRRRGLTPVDPEADGDDRGNDEEHLVPATAETVPGSAPASAPPATRKRTAAETYRLASALLKGDPTLTRDDVADALGITTRRLRDVLRQGRKSTPATAGT